MREGRAETGEDNTSTSDSCAVAELDKEETADPFSGLEGFYRRAKKLAPGDWVKAGKSFVTQAEEITSDALAQVAERFCAECGEQAPWVTSPISNQLGMAPFALKEYSQRYLRALRDADREKEERKELVAKSLAIGEELEERLTKMAKEKRATEAERGQLRAELKERSAKMAEEKRATEAERDRLRAALTGKIEENRELAQERDRLRAALAACAEEKRESEQEGDRLRAALASREEEESRRERRTPPPPQNTELEEIEMREVTPPSLPTDEIIPAILVAMEGWFEKKWDQMTSQLTPLPLRREMMCRRPPAGPVPRPGRSVGRPGRDPPRPWRQSPTNRGKGQGEVQPVHHRLLAEGRR